VLADASYVSDAQAVWVVVTIDVDVVMVKIWVLVQTPPKEELVVVGIEGGLEILRGWCGLDIAMVKYTLWDK
jgi:hypothetical protein